MSKTPKNIAASIHQRLLNVAKQTGRPFNDLVMYYAMERLLYRFSQSKHADRVVLKGGLMLRVWGVPATRVTRDIDLLGRLTNDLDSVAVMVRDVCGVAVADDGLVFDPGTVATERIAEDADYEGVRATFRGALGKVDLPMQIDFGFSDVITPEPVMATYPVMLDHPAAKLRAYNRETVVAEKFEAMVKLGELNSRMKDFFDIWVLSQHYGFAEKDLAAAIRATFARRGTQIESDPPCFSGNFVGSPAKNAQWTAFVKRSRVEPVPAGFDEVIEGVRAFVQPVAEAVLLGLDRDRRWEPPAGWR